MAFPLPFSSFIRRASLVIGLAALLAPAGCTRSLNMESTSKAISEGLTSQLTMAIASVKCPDSREIKAGDTFECIATPGAGGRLTVRVTQKDADGNIAWEVAKTEGLLDLSKVEASVRQGLAEQASLDALVTCGERWRATKAGDTFECRATGGEGQEVTVVVHVTDDTGNVSWETK